MAAGEANPPLGDPRGSEAVVAAVAGLRWEVRGWLGGGFRGLGGECVADVLFVLAFGVGEGGAALLFGVCLLDPGFDRWSVVAAAR
jgi:hypothetical protein